MVLRSNLLGTEAMVKDRIRAYRNAGITTLRVQPEGRTLDERLETLGRVVDLVKAVSAEAVASGV
jgi:biotin operon repressor